jgi:hypothetical protein
VSAPKLDAHTPGPWKVDRRSRRFGAETIRLTVWKGVKSLEMICAIAGDDSESEANARLIAAAPELLEACKAQHDAMDVLFAMLIERDKTFFPSKSQTWPAMLQGNAAIARATEANPKGAEGVRS